MNDNSDVKYSASELLAKKVVDEAMEKITKDPINDEQKILAICKISSHFSATFMVNVAANGSPDAATLKEGLSLYTDQYLAKACVMAAREGNMECAELIGTLITGGNKNGEH